MTKDEMIGRHGQLSEHEFDQTLGDGEGQGNLAYCSPQSCKESDMTEQLNKNKRNAFPFIYLYFFYPLLEETCPERLHQTKKLLFTKGNLQQTRKIASQMEEDTCKSYMIIYPKYIKNSQTPTTTEIKQL